MFILQKDMVISCAHHLPDSESLTTKKCMDEHGHNYKISVKVQRYQLKDGMVVDFGKIKDIVNQYDHKNLNTFFENPTAEILAGAIHQQVCELFSDAQALVTVDVWETPTSLVTFTT